MGLYHTFQGGCAEGANAGDGVRDTPAEAAANFGCPPDSTNSCPGNKGQLKGNDPIHNFMDYTTDSCLDRFSPLQNERMFKMWKAYRKA
jgi:hypothetical protein